MKPRTKGDLGRTQIPMLPDLTHQIASDYGCFIEVDTDSGIAFRATYLVDNKGNISHISKSDLPVSRSTDYKLALRSSSALYLYLFYIS